MRIRTGDNVVVIAGKSRGKTGKVLRVLLENSRVVVQGANIQKKHMKPKGRHPGGIIEREGSMHISNVMLVCPQTSKRTRIGYRVTKSGLKERFSKRSKEGLVQAAKSASSKKSA